MGEQLFAAATPRNAALLFITREQLKGLLRVQGLLEQQGGPHDRLLAGALVRVKCGGQYLVRPVAATFTSGGVLYLAIKGLPRGAGSVRPGDVSQTNPFASYEAISRWGQQELAELGGTLHPQDPAMRLLEAAASAWRLKVAQQWAARLDEYLPKYGLATLQRDLLDRRRIAEMAGHLETAAGSHRGHPQPPAAAVAAGAGGAAAPGGTAAGRATTIGQLAQQPALGAQGPMLLAAPAPFQQPSVDALAAMHPVQLVAPVDPRRAPRAASATAGGAAAAAAAAGAALPVRSTGMPVLDAAGAALLPPGFGGAAGAAPLPAQPAARPLAAEQAAAALQGQQPEQQTLPVPASQQPAAAPLGSNGEGSLPSYIGMESSSDEGVREDTAAFPGPGACSEPTPGVAGEKPVSTGGPAAAGLAAAVQQGGLDQIQFEGGEWEPASEDSTEWVQTSLSGGHSDPQREQQQQQQQQQREAREELLPAFLEGCQQHRPQRPAAPAATGAAAAATAATAGPGALEQQQPPLPALPPPPPAVRIGANPRLFVRPAAERAGSPAAVPTADSPSFASPSPQVKQEFASAVELLGFGGAAPAIAAAAAAQVKDLELAQRTQHAQRAQHAAWAWQQGSYWGGAWSAAAAPHYPPPASPYAPYPQGAGAYPPFDQPFGYPASSPLAPKHYARASAGAGAAGDGGWQEEGGAGGAAGDGMEGAAAGEAALASEGSGQPLMYGRWPMKDGAIDLERAELPEEEVRYILAELKGMMVFDSPPILLSTLRGTSALRWALSKGGRLRGLSIQEVCQILQDRGHLATLGLELGPGRGGLPSLVFTAEQEEAGPAVAPAAGKCEPGSRTTAKQAGGRPGSRGSGAAAATAAAAAAAAGGGARQSRQSEPGEGGSDSRRGGSRSGGREEGSQGQGLAKEPSKGRLVTARAHEPKEGRGENAARPRPGPEHNSRRGDEEKGARGGSGSGSKQEKGRGRDGEAAAVRPPAAGTRREHPPRHKRREQGRDRPDGEQRRREGSKEQGWPPKEERSKERGGEGGSRRGRRRSRSPAPADGKRARLDERSGREPARSLSIGQAEPSPPAAPARPRPWVVAGVEVSEGVRQVLIKALKRCRSQFGLPMQLGAVGLMMRSIDSSQKLPCKLGAACEALAAEGLLTVVDSLERANTIPASGKWITQLRC